MWKFFSYINFLNVEILIILPAQSAEVREYTNSISAEGQDPPPLTSVLDMTLNNLKVRLQ